jgi:hypothetical protein
VSGERSLRARSEPTRGTCIFAIGSEIHNAKQDANKAIELSLTSKMTEVQRRGKGALALRQILIFGLEKIGIAGRRLRAAETTVKLEL